MSDSLKISHGDSLAVHRLLDANLNRAQEALRTLEDIARFRDQSHLQGEYKSLRHALVKATSSWEAALLVQSRNAGQDVGREVKGPEEANRGEGFPSISAAASQRVQQALRCLEEGAKYRYPASAESIERVRYRVYDLNSALCLSLQRDVPFLQNAKLYCLANCDLPLEAFRERIRAISQSGADIIQVREKVRDAQEILQYVAAALDSVDSARTRIIVNDRADLCLLGNAFGLHVGQTDLSVAQARKVIPTRSIVGLSTHDLDQVREAMAVGADYIGCGPTFPSRTKSFDEFAGLDFLEQVAGEVDQRALPAFAIGGIDASNLAQVLATGIERVVVGSAIWRSETPAKATQEIRAILG